jgi:hypothetical protein
MNIDIDIGMDIGDNCRYRARVTNGYQINTELARSQQITFQATHYAQGIPLRSSKLNTQYIRSFQLHSRSYL